MKKTFSMAPECCAMGLSSVRVDTGGGGCVQTKMRFFTIFGEIGGESRKMRGEIAGDILPAVKSCRGRHGEIVPTPAGTVKLHPPRLGGCSGGERITT